MVQLSFKYKQAIFNKFMGRYVPLQPWPQTFFVSDISVCDRTIELRTLTLTSLIKAVIQNFVTMNYHRLLIIMWKMGFFNTNISQCFSWSQFRIKFWNVLKERQTSKYTIKGA